MIPIGAVMQKLKENDSINIIRKLDKLQQAVMD